MKHNTIKTCQQQINTPTQTHCICLQTWCEGLHPGLQCHAQVQPMHFDAPVHGCQRHAQVQRMNSDAPVYGCPAPCTGAANAFQCTCAWVPSAMHRCSECTSAWVPCAMHRCNECISCILMHLCMGAQRHAQARRMHLDAPVHGCLSAMSENHHGGCLKIIEWLLSSLHIV